MIAEVIVDLVNSETDKIFEYKAIEGVCVGSHVKVPFGNSNKLIDAYVIALKEKTNYPVEKLKKITFCMEQLLTEECLYLVERMSKRYQQPKASIFRLLLPSVMRTGNITKKIEKWIYYIEDCQHTSISQRAKRQQEALHFLQKTKICKATDFSKKFSREILKIFIEKGIIYQTLQNVDRKPYQFLEESISFYQLTHDQRIALKSIKDSPHQIELLHGVTGSGKTEIYLQLIADAMQKEKTAILLVPEISLTPQMLQQLRSRFQEKVAILHSRLSDGEKLDEWTRLKDGKAKIAVGARSAIFAPVENVGVIIIDEEHDGSYQSESSPRYNAIAVAKMRAKYNQCKLILGSATPSIESYLNAKLGKYGLITLQKRINQLPMPEITVVDMRLELRNGNLTPFSGQLQIEIENCLKAKQQVILFLNRRGFAKSVLCRECGYVHVCMKCDVALTYHREDDCLKCHFCGMQYQTPNACVSCGSRHLIFQGYGTQKIVSELMQLYPNAKILRMDNDTTSGKHGHYNIVESFAKQEADILVGTQMVAKGHNFKNVALVGILDADQSLYFSDYRSVERTFQLVTQVAGRSGRAEVAGKVILQTYTPENPLFGYIVEGNYVDFFENELRVRQATFYPPYAIVVRILFTGNKKEKVVEVLKEVYTKLETIYKQDEKSFIFFKKMYAPIKKIQNKWRYQILMRILDKKLLADIYHIALKYKTNQVNVYIEENPNNLS